MLYNYFMTTHEIHVLSDSEAVRLTPLGTHSGMDITLQNINNSGTIYIGGEGVTSESYGFKLAAGAAISFELPGLDALYAIGSAEGLELAKLVIGLED